MKSFLSQNYLRTDNKRPESYAVGMSSIILSLGVEFTNSYQEREFDFSF